MQSRLGLLTIHFPKLRILWCQSAHATSKLFRDLKKGVSEPEVEKALTITSDDTTNRDRKYNIAPYDTLMKLPCISTKNIRLVTENVRDIKQLISMGTERMAEVLSNQQYAQSITTFLTTEYIPETSNTTDRVQPALSSKRSSAHKKTPTKSSRK